MFGDRSDEHAAFPQLIEEIKKRLPEARQKALKEKERRFACRSSRVGSRRDGSRRDLPVSMTLSRHPSRHSSRQASRSSFTTLDGNRGGASAKAPAGPTRKFGSERLWGSSRRLWGAAGTSTSAPRLPGAEAVEAMEV